MKDNMEKLSSGLRVAVLYYNSETDFAQAWLNAPPENTDIYVLLHPGHAKAPPALIQVFGLDPLRDEGILYGKVLKEAGVKVKTEMLVLPHTLSKPRT